MRGTGNYKTQGISLLLPKHVAKNIEYILLNAIRFCNSDPSQKNDRRDSNCEGTGHCSN